MHVSMDIQLTDRSINQPLGIIQNVLVNMHDSYFPVDFIVMDIKEDNHTPLILDRSFIATAKATFDVQEGHVTLRCGEEEIILEISMHTTSIIASSKPKISNALHPAGVYAFNLHFALPVNRDIVTTYKKGKPKQK